MNRKFGELWMCDSLHVDTGILVDWHTDPQTDRDRHALHNTPLL